MEEPTRLSASPSGKTGRMNLDAHFEPFPQPEREPAEEEREKRLRDEGIIAADETGKLANERDITEIPVAPPRSASPRDA